MRFVARRPLRVIAAAALAVLLLPASAFAATPPSAGPGRVLGVSIPPDPLTLKPGDTKTVDVKITNAGTTSFQVTIEGRALSLGDEGAVGVTDQNDVRWENQIDFPHGALTIPAQGWHDAAVKIRMPTQIEPDTYLIGFVVAPLPVPGGSVKVVNQVASFFTVDVPGPRNPKLQADFAAAGVVFGSKAEGRVRVRNAGRVATRFWAETDVASSPGGGLPKQGRLPKALLPAGRVKTFTITGNPNWPVGFVTMRVRLMYPGTTDATTRDILLTHKILVIHPYVVYGAIGLVALFVFWLVRRRVTRRRVTPAKRTGAQRARGDRAARHTPRPATAEPVDEPEPDGVQRVVRRARRSGLRRWFGGASARPRARVEHASSRRRAPAPTTVGSRSSRRRSRRR